MKLKTLPIFLAFLAMGFGDAVGPFVGLAKESFSLSNTMAQLIPFVGFIMFGLLSVPMGIYQDKKGKKFILMLGLGLALVGLLIPAIFGLTTYEYFLLTVLLLGAGATTLQVAGNPIMRDVSEEGKFARNLTIGQFVKAIGSLSGPVLPAAAAYFWSGDWRIVFPVYCTALVITLLFVAFLDVKEKKAAQKSATLASCVALLGNKYVLTMVLGIFLYVGAEVCMSSGIPLYLQAEYQVDLKTLGLLGTGFFFLALTIGRFLGSVILNWISPKTFFITTSLISMLGLLGLFVGNQIAAIASVFLVGLGFANIFPLIFSITVDAMPERTNELSGLMITAIVGGAFIPPFMGVLADKTSVVVGFLVPLMAVFYITWIAFTVKREKA
jgi:MFS transporter, FHS family, L-fucose permease